MHQNCQSNPTNGQWKGPRQHLEAWRQLGADKALLTAIQFGVKSPLNAVPEPKPCRTLTNGETASMMTTIGEYCVDGAIRQLTEEETQRTKVWTPIFPREKKDSQKIRIITDMRQLNMCQQVPKHKADTWQTVLDTIKNPDLQWAITLDLKSWFHHLQIHPKTQRWMRFKFQDKGYQIVSMPFGWALSPYWANKLTKPIRGWMNEQRWDHTWWVDDVLLLGCNKQQVEDRATALVHKLTELGVSINAAKSMTTAAQHVTYLGHQIDLKKNVLTPQPEKNTQSIKMTKHQLKAHTIVPKHLAALAGNLLDMTKSNAGLHGIPQQLMRAAALAVTQNQKKLPHWCRLKAWGLSTKKDRIPHLTELLRQTLWQLQNPMPKMFRPHHQQQWVLQSDASDHGWGGTLMRNRQEKGSCAQKWSPQERALHITHREALASAWTVQELLHLIPTGSHLTIQTDASSTAWGWRKGSRNRQMNSIIAPIVRLLHQKQIFYEAAHIPGQNNRRADWLSRNSDPKDYKLSEQIYDQICHKYQLRPQMDLFANRHNKKCPKYCSWRVDRRSQGNAFQIPWSPHTCWLNPPWELIARALNKAIQEGGVTALVCLPVWRSAPWWRTVLRLQVTEPTILKGVPLYHNPDGDPLPPPRWGTLFTVIQT